MQKPSIMVALKTIFSNQNNTNNYECRSLEELVEDSSLNEKEREMAKVLLARKQIAERRAVNTFKDNLQKNRNRKKTEDLLINKVNAKSLLKGKNEKNQMTIEND